MMLGAILASVLIGIGVSTWRVATRKTVTLEPVEGSRIEGLHHVRYVEGRPVLSVTLDGGVIRRPEFGVFRIGFMRELVARNLSIEVTLGNQTEKGFDLREIKSVFGEITGSSGVHEFDLTSVTVEGVELRVVGAEGAVLELHAESCSGGLTTQGRLAMRDVKITVEGRRHHLATLEFDPRKGEFTGATLSEGPDDRAARRDAVQEALQELNGAFHEIVPDGRDARGYVPGRTATHGNRVLSWMGAANRGDHGRIRADARFSRAA